MSFILDALRKSEHDRERRALPAMVERTAGVARRSRLPLVLGALGLLLLANLLVLAAYLRRPPPPAVAAAVVAARAPLAAPGPPTATPEPAAAVPRTRPLDSEASDAEPESAAPEPPPTPRALAGREPALVRARGAPAAAPGEERAAPTLNELPDQAANGLPRLSLELHVYSATPAERFVVLNGQRLREGATLREGPTLERITPDGAILSYRGTRFQLPRQ